MRSRGKSSASPSPAGREAIHFDISQSGRAEGTDGSTFIVDGGIQACEWLEGKDELLMCGRRFVGIFEAKRRRKSLTKVLDLLAVAVASVPKNTGDLLSASKHTRNIKKHEINVVTLHTPNDFLLWSLQLSGKNSIITVLVRGSIDSVPLGEFPPYTKCALSPSANVMISPLGDLYVTKDGCGHFWAKPPQSSPAENGSLFRSIDVSIPPLHNSDAYTHNPDKLTARQACAILVAAITSKGTLFIYRAYDIQASGARRNKIMENTSKSTAAVFKMTLAGKSFVDLVFHPNRRILFTTTLKTIIVYVLKVTGDRRTEADAAFSSDDEDIKSWAKEVGSPIITVRQKVEVHTGGVHTFMTCSKNGKYVGIAHTCGRVTIRLADTITALVWDIQLFNSPITSFSISSPSDRNPLRFKTVKLVGINHEGTLMVQELPSSKRSYVAIFVTILFVIISIMRMYELRII
eukprot:TRINITY_DN13971_c0_g1_i1.p1 TRINITY_DN13971_c0_g1~~TRINITY_DN13971_c0_g1_i1.p1  ORF type:complete len:462 (+),score=38.79 TRINITY_DN13971_c0_g1_i1:152-1537(+)